MQSLQNLDAMLADVREALAAFEGQAISGANIHRLITDAAPTLDIRSVVEMPSGPGALTKFIETYLSDIVKRIGKKGDDILYGIGEGVVPPAQVHDTSVWKAFVSPNAVNHLCLRPSDLKLIAVETPELDDGETHQIPKATEDEHNAILQGFLDGLPDSQRVLLEPEDANQFSYDKFVQALRANGLMKLWGRFRRDAFKKLLIERLECLPINKDAIPGIANQLMSSQKALHQQDDKKPTSQINPTNNMKSTALARRDEGNAELARSLAKSAIDQMSYDEIRGIQLPLGAVLDALSARI